MYVLGWTRPPVPVGGSAPRGGPEGCVALVDVSEARGATPPLRIFYYLRLLPCSRRGRS